MARPPPSPPPPAGALPGRALAAFARSAVCGASARHVGLRDGPLDDRPDRLARRAVEDVKPALLGRSRDDFARASVDRDVGQDGRRRHVEIPDRMMGELEVPLALTGPQIDRDQTLAVEIGTRPVAAVIVRRRRLDREIDEAEILIDADLRPYAGVAVGSPRAVFPGLVSGFARARNRVEPPKLLAGLHVIGAHDALGVVVGGDGCAFAHRRADDRDIARDGGRRMPADLACLEIYLLVVAFDHADFEIADTVIAERRNHLACLGVELDEAIARRDVEDAFIAPAVGPIGHAAAGQLPWRDRGA